MMRHIPYIIILTAAAACLLAACRNERPYRIAPRPVPAAKIARYDSLLLQYHATDDTARLAQLAAGGAPFWEIYCRHVLRLDDAPYFSRGIGDLLQDTTIARLFADTERAYADLRTEEAKLTALAGRYASLFPDKPLPHFGAHLSGLRHSVVVVDSLLSVSLDCYIDSTYPLYAQRYNSYELPLHHRGRIVPDVGEVLLRNALPPAPAHTLLDAMVYEGKILYLLAGLLDCDDTGTVTGYTPAQARWCSDNEQAIWNAIVGNSHLFASDPITIRKFIAPAPFTAPLTQDAPGRIGRWVGMRIVEGYARHQRLSPAELAADTTAATDVLRLSHYTGH